MLNWPTALAINPLDDSLYILDNNLILRLTPDRKVTVVAGHLVHCPNSRSSLEIPRLSLEMAKPITELTGSNLGGMTGSGVEMMARSDSETMTFGPTTLPPLTSHQLPMLNHPQHLSFAPNGDLYVVERDGLRQDRIRMLTSDGRILPYAGTKADCACWRGGCDCSNTMETVVMANASLRLSAELAITPDSVVHIADSGRLQVLSVLPDLPQADRSGQYEIRDVEAREAYVFNRYGQHIATRSLRTGRYVYNFTYNANSYYSKLTRVTDRAGNVTMIQRDYRLQARELVLQNGQGFGITMDYMGRLQSFTDSKNSSTTFTYVGNTGLIRTKQTSGRRMFEYDYDGFGHVRSVIVPTGERISTDVDSSDPWVVFDSGLQNRSTAAIAEEEGSVGQTQTPEKQGSSMMHDSGLGDES